jgi:hypothetical protein
MNDLYLKAKGNIMSFISKREAKISPSSDISGNKKNVLLQMTNVEH